MTSAAVVRRQLAERYGAVLARGAGAPDLFPERERRLHDAMVRFYELQHSSLDDLRRIADAWRPFRTWTALLLRRWYEDRR